MLGESRDSAAAQREVCVPVSVPLLQERRAYLRVESREVLLGEGQAEGRPPAHCVTGLMFSPSSISPAVFVASFTLKRIQILINTQTWLNLQGILPGLKPTAEGGDCRMPLVHF